MNKKKLIILSLFAFGHLCFGQVISNCYTVELQKVIKLKNDYLFLEVVDSLKKDHQNGEKCLSNSTVLDLLIKYYEQHLRDSINDSLYVVHFQISDLLKNNAEYSEWIGEDFSDFFVKNIGKALKLLDKIKDTSAIDRIANDASFIEGNNAKILDYIVKNKLQNHNYYKYFINYKD